MFAVCTVCKLLNVLNVECAVCSVFNVCSVCRVTNNQPVCNIGDGPVGYKGKEKVAGVKWQQENLNIAAKEFDKRDFFLIEDIESAVFV